MDFLNPVCVPDVKSHKLRRVGVCPQRPAWLASQALRAWLWHVWKELVGAGGKGGAGLPGRGSKNLPSNLSTNSVLSSSLNHPFFLPHLPLLSPVSVPSGVLWGLKTQQVLQL